MRYFQNIFIKNVLWLFSSVFSLNSQKQVSYEVNSGVQSISLGRNASHEMLKIDKTKATFPLILSFNFVVTVSLKNPIKKCKFYVWFHDFFLLSFLESCHWWTYAWWRRRWTKCTTNWECNELKKSCLNYIASLLFLFLL